MPSWREAFPSSYLKAEDLQGKEWPLIIASAGPEEVFDETKFVLTFANCKKGMIANKTNCEALETLYGDNYLTWPGKEILLSTHWTQYQGKRMKGLLIKPPQGPRTAAPLGNGGPLREHVVEHRATHDTSSIREPAPSMDDEIPF